MGMSQDHLFKQIYDTELKCAPIAMMTQIIIV